MHFVNTTRMQAGYTVGLERSGRELLVVVVKGTFVLPRPGEQVRLQDEQQPLVFADSFAGEPGLSAPVYEVDFAPRKQACDVLLLGSAHAPAGRPCTSVGVSLRVGSMEKSLRVVGDRAWDAGATGIRSTPPQAFVQQPISYDVAFGGVDQESDDPSEHDAYMLNPVGRGYRKHLEKERVQGKPLPNTEEPGQAVTWPAGKYKPMALGPVGRGWDGRKEYAGTYDEKWLDEVFPFLPGDFDDRYYQAAPLDQQMPVPREPLDVELTGLTTDGKRRFVLPYLHAPVQIAPQTGSREAHSGLLDTIVFEPDHDRITLTWRVTRPLRKSIFEIAEVRIGVRGRARWDADAGAFGPTYAVAPAARLQAAASP